MIRRIAAYLINKLILIILVNCAFWLVHYNCGLNQRLSDPFGLLFISIFLYTLFLPFAVWELVNEWGSTGYMLEIGTEIMIIIISFIIIDTIFSYLFQGDIGKRAVALKISSSNGNKASFIQILLRSIIKYMSITFLPVALIYPLLNKLHITLHDKIAKTIVTDTDD